MLKVFFSCIKNDLKTLQRKRADWIHPIIFFLVFISLFGIGLGFENQQLIAASPAIIWITFLLISLTTIDNLFKREQEEGTLTQLVLSPYPLWWLLLAKAVVFWLVACLPLILLMPLFGFIMQLEGSAIGGLWLSLLVGSPALTLLGMVGATLTTAMPRSGIFLALLLLPLYVPILILGESVVVQLLATESISFQLALLSALSVFALIGAPHAAAGALKAALDE
ncbi:heme exporter protein CcmB [Candidatus Berkiella aquae]|uniref:Heme exporter protein B n=1 Tax=Candidatus Berkiella aquae TaxID=295108 RepID=A0A0Q9YLA9_9GAMM|nr:heme exporter protein CcmB [Candidatus Berkiella aquae]MCS5711400.1 heme exporter protein CcmB [Candidatus Berkiella aquae]